MTRVRLGLAAWLLLPVSFQFAWITQTYSQNVSSSDISNLSNSKMTDTRRAQNGYGLWDEIGWKTSTGRVSKARNLTGFGRGDNNIVTDTFYTNNMSSDQSEFNETGSPRHFTNTESVTMSLPVSDSIQVVSFDIYLHAKTNVRFTTSDTKDDLQLTLNTTGTDEQAVNNVQLIYNFFEEENETVVQLKVVQNLDLAATSSGELKIWRIIVPVILCVVCVLVMILCTVKYARRRGLLYLMRPSNSTLATLHSFYPSS